MFIVALHHPNRRHDFVFLCSFRLIAYFPRSILLLSSMRSYRRTIKFGIRQCLLVSFDAILLLLFLFILALIFSGIGVKLFGGLIQASGNDTFPGLDSSSFGENNYYVLNYNDPLMALGSLFVLLMVNNSFILARGIEEATTGSSCRIFFICWYILGVLFLLNLFTASILNSFMGFWLARHQVSSNSDSGDEEEVAIVVPKKNFIDSRINPSNTLSLKPHGELISTKGLNYSSRIRYSNLDDEIYQWMSIFQDDKRGETRHSFTYYHPVNESTNDPNMVPHPTDPDQRGTDSLIAVTLENYSLSEPPKYLSQFPPIKYPTNPLHNDYPMTSSNHSNSALRDARPSFLPDIPEQGSVDIRDSVGSDHSVDQDLPPRSRIFSLQNISAFPENFETFDHSQKDWDNWIPGCIRSWIYHYKAQRSRSMTIAEYAATLLQCAKNGRNGVTFKSRAHYLCYRTTKAVIDPSFLSLIYFSMPKFFDGHLGFCVH
jgi:hypothetical protein